MGAEDEFRKVAEDVRQLARTLRSELRTAQRDARNAARQVRDDMRQEFHHGHARPGHYAGWSYDGTRRAPRPPPAPVFMPPRPPRPPRAPRVRPSRPPVRHKHDGSTLLSLLLVLSGLAWLVSQTHLFDVSAEAVLAIALAVLGAGMVITARTDWSLSRRHWPVWLGAGLLVVLIAAANSAEISGGLSSLNMGPESFQPANWTAAKGEVDNFAGPIDVDLTSLPGNPAADERLVVRDVFGPVRVTVPASPPYHLHVIGKAVFGPTRMPVQAGRSSDRIADFGPSTGPTYTLDLRTVFGPLTVAIAR
ncbi:MAG: hypothetical protein ACYDH6_14390 [Acidimicrobiales bacterium]